MARWIVVQLVDTAGNVLAECEDILTEGTAETMQIAAAIMQLEKENPRIHLLDSLGSGEALKIFFKSGPDAD